VKVNVERDRAACKRATKERPSDRMSNIGERLERRRFCAV